MCVTKGPKKSFCEVLSKRKGKQSFALSSMKSSLLLIRVLYPFSSFLLSSFLHSVLLSALMFFLYLLLFVFFS